MISGYDKILKSSAASEFVFTQAVLISRYVWPDAVVENGDTGELLTPIDGDWSEVFAGIREIMIYRNEKDRILWEDEGAIPETLNTMVHVIKARWDSVTVVVDNPAHPEMKKIFAGLRRVLVQHARPVQAALV